jgi:hypothetical protein
MIMSWLSEWYESSVFRQVRTETLIIWGISALLVVAVVVKGILQQRFRLKKKHQGSTSLLWGHLAKFRDFQAGEVFISPDSEAAIAVDIQRQKVCLASIGEKPVVVPAASISEAEIITNKRSTAGQSFSEELNAAYRQLTLGKEKGPTPVIESIGLRIVVKGTGTGGGRGGDAMTQDVYVIPFFNRNGRDDVLWENEMTAALQWLKTINKLRHDCAAATSGEALEISDVCSRCHKAIARSDQAFVLDGQVLCGDCNHKLRGT